jgi:hypothetical protein
MAEVVRVDLDTDFRGPLLDHRPHAER